MSQARRREHSPTPRTDPSLGATTVTACWSPLAQPAHGVVCTTSDIVGGVPPHMHARHHVGVVEQGTATLQSEGRRWTVHAGDLIWHAPRQIHSMCSEHCHCRWIELDEQAVERIAAASGTCVPEETRVFSDGSRAAEFVELHRRLERGAVTRSAATTLAGLIAAEAGARGIITAWPPVLTPELERCRIAIRNRYAESVRLIDLARLAGMSLFHLARRFARALSVPPHTYLLHLRVAWAQTLLRRGLSGSRVAYEVGFSDQSHCIRAHRRLLGVTPLTVLALERELPAIADGFARLPDTAMRAAASIWRP
jgi:AraC-like DNA-binding protein